MTRGPETNETSIASRATAADRDRAIVPGAQRFSRNAAAGLSGQVLAIAAGGVGRAAAARDPVLGGFRTRPSPVRHRQRRMGAGDFPLFSGSKLARRARIFQLAAW